VEAIIDIQQLDYALGQRLVLKQITLPVEAGQTLGIIGPNGGGKTTLLRLLLGVVKPTRGSITVAGLPPKQAVAQGDLVGYLPQSYSYPDNFPLTVRQVARLGLVARTGILRAYAKADLEFVERVLDLVGMTDLADRPVGSLSGGQRQRLFIARALAPRPRLLLLDEPTTGIDQSGQQQFVQFIQNLKRELDLTVVIVSHDLRAISSMADRIACLNVTLHFHDIPQRMPSEVMYRLFSCDLGAMGLPKPTVTGG
jgi:zinc transport system ATP-binding protein